MLDLIHFNYFVHKKINFKVNLNLYFIIQLHFIFIIIKIMKRTKKIVSTGVLASAIILSTWLANASFGEEMQNNANSMHNEMQNNANSMQSNVKAQWEDIHKKAKEMRTEYKTEMKENKNNEKWFITKTRATIKWNLKEFKNSYESEMKAAFKSVSKDVKKSLKETRAEFRTQAKDLIQKMKDKSTSFEEKIKLKNELDNLREEKFNQIKKELASNPNALKMLEIRKAVFEKNKDLRANISTKREEFRMQRSAMIERYKELIIKKVWDRIDKLSEAKLKIIDTRIDKAYTKIENNKRLDASHRVKILSLLDWLKDAINDKLSILNETTSDSTDIIDQVIWQ